MEKRRKLSNTLPTMHIAAIALVLTCVLFLWRYSGCPGPPQNLTIMSSSASFLLVQPGNASHFPPPYVHHSLGGDDLKRLIDVRDFRFILNHPEVCNNSDTLKMPLVVIVVHSAPENSHKRGVIRTTWGSSLKVIFMLGKTLDQKLQEKILQEDSLYNDLIIGNFIDSYRNMTYKHVMALKWTTYHCTQARYLLKTDDDVFVNPSALLHFLEHNLSPLGARRLIYCQTMPYGIVRRSFRSKWRVSYTEYPHSVYPPYCLGWAVLYSPDVVFTLYRESQSAEYFWIDDVFVTGLMATRAHIPRSDLGNKVLNLDRMKQFRTGDLTKSSFIFGPPNLSSKEIFELWKLVSIENTITSTEHQDKAPY